MKTNIVLSLLGVLLLVAIAAIFYWLWLVTGSFNSDSSTANVTQRLMQRKMAATLELRNALSGEKWSSAAHSASQLREIGQKSEWFLKNERYAAHSRNFRTALDQLENALVDQDAAAVATSYGNLISSCVGCHEHYPESDVDPALLQFERAASARQRDEVVDPSLQFHDLNIRRDKVVPADRSG